MAPCVFCSKVFDCSSGKDPAHKNGQLNISELVRVCDISRTTAYKYIGLLEA